MTDVIERANGGDATALADVRQVLDEFPELIENLGGDLAETAESALIAAAAGERLAMAEALRRNLRQLENDLAGTKPSAIEKLLVRRIAICWLQVAHADCLSAQADDVPVSHANYLQRNQDQAHRRLLSSIKTLATVRRMISRFASARDLTSPYIVALSTSPARWSSDKSQNSRYRFRPITRFSSASIFSWEQLNRTP